VKIIRIIKIIAVNLAVFAVLLMAVNWACGYYLKKANKNNRAALPNYSTDYEHAKAVFADYNRVQHQYEPFVGWRTLPYKGKTTHISEAGLRTHEPPERNRDPRAVVRFFGGSTMWGEGSDDQHTIPALFNLLHPEFAVFNHGQLAYNTRQELDALISLYSKNEKTDIVVFYDGVNDAAFLCPKVIKDLPAHRLVPMYREKLYTGKFALVEELAGELFVEDILAVIRKLTYRPTPETSPYDCTGKPGKAEAIAEMMMKNWEMAHELVSSRNGKFIAFLQPAAFIGNPKTDHLDLDDELGRNFREVYRLIREKIAARNYPWVVDLSEKFDGGEYIFIDFCHVSPNGNEIIAREIAKAMQELTE
jgi:hypothetical protein